MTSNNIDIRLLELAEATTFRPVAMRICTIAGNMKSSIAEVEALLEMDPVLSAKTLQVANSPFFSRGRRTDTLSHAVAIVGMDALRIIVVSASIHDIYKSSMDIDKKLWSHSLGVSLTASMLARASNLADEAVAAAAGLFHDAGKLLIRSAYPGPYSEMIESIEGSTLSFCDAEDSIFRVNHTIAGGLLARNWNLPREYSLVIAHHHGWDMMPDVPPHESDLVKIISIADAVAFFYGIGLKREIDLFELPYKSVGLSKSRFNDLVWEVDEIYEEYINSLSL